MMLRLKRGEGDRIRALKIQTPAVNGEHAVSWGQSLTKKNAKTNEEI